MQSGSPAPQPTPKPLLPVPTQPATLAELEAAVAALTEKKRRLREAFDRLVACSPGPVPFRWEDLDAHLAFVAANFRHLDPIHADAAAVAAAGGGPSHLDKVEQDRERRVERVASEEGRGSNAEEEEEDGNASLDQERGEEVREASGARPGREPDEAGNGRIEAVPIEVETAPGQLDEEEEEEDAVNASPDKQGREAEAEDGKCQHPRTTPGGEAALSRAIAAACADTDPSTLVDVLCVSSRGSLCARRAFLPALLGAPDPHALLIRAVGGFLDSAGREVSKCWANCVALIECAPRLLAAPSADALAQAKRLAGHWKEMLLTRPVGRRDMGRMAGWGLLTFTASYNIVLEFDSDEIARLFSNIAPQVKDDCVELCKRLGLFEKMTDSINRFIENGQPLDAIRLARTFNLTGKYPTLTIMNDYVENAKKAAEDILSKESYTLESLNQAMAKKVDALIFSWSAVDGCNIDSVHRSNIKAEITQLLHKYANKQQRLADVSASTSSSRQQPKFQEEYQQWPQVQLLEEQQQQKSQELQQKPEEKQNQQQKPQELQHQHIQNQQELQEREQRWMWQGRKRKRQNKNRKRKRRRQEQQQQHKRPRLCSYARAGIHNQHGHPFSGVRGAPFAAYTRPRYFSSFDHSQHHVSCQCSVIKARVLLSVVTVLVNCWSN